ncbi:DNA polymerase III subunit beta [Proteiniborus sp. MB09-C3]|uniref:DNA polymerase III subunit beta n=1 Tax=Proteiniborus sp. MB09-C3 TaxID=3050072 RepID=UPI002555FC99|nr:DNA polymerase III subunit beta [Proteiniborus sp. MB09-C3]WIV12598.1 DNA polymerase III subunit beta [Proteiniborus sp. MB09-C3]
MKFRIQQKDLSKCINVVQKGISSKSTLPILSGILLEAEEGKLKLTGTDLEIGIKSSIDCDIIEEGSIVITSRIFGDIVRKLPDLPIDIYVDGNNNIHIDCGNSKFNLIGLSATDYPQLPEIYESSYFEIPKDLLKSMIRQTIFAAAQDETRPILTGALFETSDNNASLVAIDGYRLAVKNVSVNVDENIKVVIPAKTLNEVNKILEDDDAEVKISCTTGNVIFNFGDTIITSRLLEGQFLNYNDIIRNEYKLKIKVKTRDLQECLERASLLAREGKNNLVKLDISDDRLIITSNSEIGNVFEELPIVLEGNDIKIAFNSKYILEGIKAIDSEEIVMYMTSNINPCIIRPAEDSSYTYLVLPVRLAAED